MRAGVALAAIAALALAGAPAFAGGGQDHAARVERFLAVLPDHAELDKVDTELDENDKADLARIIAANPGKEPAVRTVISARAKCHGEASQAMTSNALHRAADALTDQELDQLIAFYSGPDFARLEGIKDDSPEMAELMKRYPLQRFLESTRTAMGGMFDDAMTGYSRCDAAAEAGFAKAGVKAD